MNDSNGKHAKLNFIIQSISAITVSYLISEIFK